MMQRYENDLDKAIPLKSYEILTVNGRLKAINNFQLIDIPRNIYAKVMDKISNDSKLLNAAKLMGLESKNIPEKYIRCNYGSYNLIPDIIDGILQEPSEMIDCQIRDTCPGNGRFCKMPGKLTPREWEYAINTTKGLADCEISNIMGVTLNTIHVFRRRVQAKIKARSKLDIVRWVMQIVPTSFI